MDNQTEKLIRCGLGNLIGSSRLIGKLAGATFPESKEAGIKNKLQWQAIVIPSGQ
jgi:hypothetical protein